MPLAWTHAEYLKLVASRALKRPFDRPESVWRRYGGKRSTPRRAPLWCEHAAITAMAPGMSLVLALREPADRALRLRRLAAHRGCTDPAQ